MARPRVDLQDRFWQKVDAAGENECWEWMNNKNEWGYGQIGSGGGNGKMLSAHRVSWEIHNGEIPDGLHVLHKCDNPACVNPAHLFLGTHQDSMDDMATKGRRASVKGERNACAKLTKAQVIEIRRRYAAGGVTHKQLAKEHGVARQTVGDLIAFKYWAHVGVQ